MKNLSLILNAILIVAVGVLYYFHFKQHKSMHEQHHTSNDSSAVIIKPLSLSTQLQGSKILYINADTLNAKYEFVQRLLKDTQAKQSSLEATYNMRTEKFQQEYMDYQQKIQANAVSIEQAKAIEENLAKKKNEIDQMEGQMNNLLADAQKKNLQVQKEVFSFLKEFTKNKGINYVLTYSESSPGLVYANDSLDITKQVLEGLNAKYKSKNK